MYLIRRIQDGMWLLGSMRGDCGMPTCIWGDRLLDALPFESPYPAMALAREIGGGCEVVFKAAKEG